MRRQLLKFILSASSAEIIVAGNLSLVFSAVAMIDGWAR